LQELVADNFYFLKAVGYEGGGGDNLAVAVTIPSGVFLGPIPVEGGMSEDSPVNLFTSATIDAPEPTPIAVSNCEVEDPCAKPLCLQEMIDAVQSACCPVGPNLFL
jgi:hypothetical protein